MKPIGLIARLFKGKYHAAPKHRKFYKFTLYAQVNERRKKLIFSMVSKTKGLRSSLREKKRYIVYECVSEKKLSPQAIREEIKRKMLSWLGEYGYGSAGVMFVKEQGNKGVIRVNTKYVDLAKTAISLVKEINSSPVIIKSI